jgi:hypothetical protein
MNIRIIRISFIVFSSVFIFFTPVLHAKSIKANYSVEFGILGEVARAHATLTSNRKGYSIDATVLVVGPIARAVTDSLKERHVSKGHVVNGLLVTDMYQMIKSYGEYSSTTIYRVNHRKKRVTRHYIKWEKKKEIINEKVTLGYYGRDDMMTFFINLPRYIKEKHKSKNYRFSVVGADRKNGRVDVVIPSKNALKQMNKLVGKGKKGDWYTKVVMHRKLYNSEQGELEVRMDKDSLVEKAVLKDLIFFGDVRIIRQ